jgi:hypothetical protein
MKITIDTKELIKNELTLDEYYILYSLYKKEYFELFAIFNCEESTVLLSDLVKGLELKGFVKDTKGIISIVGDLTLIYLKLKALDLFEEDLNNPDRLFETFWNTYPIKVPDGRGSSRILRSKDSDTKQALELKKKYIQLIKVAGTHTKIIKGLTGYLSNMRNKMTYVVGIEVFFNQFMWEKYLDEEIVDNISEEKTERI